MALTAADRALLNRCLANEPKAWEEFVDRFLGLVVHTVHQTAKQRGYELSRQDVEDLSADVLAALLVQDFATLRRFRGESSLATYLAVIARRVVVRDLLHKKPIVGSHRIDSPEVPAAAGEHPMLDREEVDQLLRSLEGNDATIVRMFYLEGLTYEEISQKTGVPINSIGPTLSRAKSQMRRAADSKATV